MPTYPEYTLQIPAGPAGEAARTVHLRIYVDGSDVYLEDTDAGVGSLGSDRRFVDLSSAQASFTARQAVYAAEVLDRTIASPRVVRTRRG